MTAKINPLLTRAEALASAWKQRGDYKGYDKSKGSSFNSWRAIIYTAKGKAAGFPEAWKDYSCFMREVQGAWQKNMIVCRINTKEPHSHSNSYWAEKGMESLSKLVRLEYDGEEKTLMEWAAHFGLNYQGVRQRYFRGKNLTPHEIIFGKKKTHKSEADRNKHNRLTPMLGAYKLRDKKKNLTCDIELKWLRDFVAGGCHYCGDKHRVGLDRIDNTKGHTKDNVVASCYDCNCARNNNFTYEEMLLIGETIRKIKSCR